MSQDVTTLTIERSGKKQFVTVREVYDVIRLWLEGDGEATRTFMTSPGDLIEVRREQVKDFVAAGT